MAQQRYIYGSAAPKHDFYNDALTRRESRHARDFEVVPGGHRHQQASAAYDIAMRAARIALIAVLVFAFVGFARITLSSATITEAVKTTELESGISELKSDISHMQAEKSSLSNPVKIKSDASALGMISPYETVIVTLEKDVVAIEEDGSLSLTKSLGQVE